MKGAILSTLPLVAAFVYLPLVRAPFLYDDTVVIEHDPPVARLLHDKSRHDIAILDHIWLAPRPLRQLTHRIEYRLAGPNPAVGHVVNIFLHFAVAAAGGLLLSILGVRTCVCLAAVALFVLNPVGVESVGIVSHRKEMLSALFLLLGLSASMARSKRLFLLSFPCFLLAMLGKETAVLFPGLQLAILLANRFRKDGESYGGRMSCNRFLAGVAFAAGLCLLARWQISASMAYLHSNPFENPFRAGHFFQESGWIEPAFTAVSALPRYLFSFVWPFGHSLDPIPWNADASSFALCVLGCVGVGAAAWVCRRTRFFLPLVWIPIALSPYLLPNFTKSGATAFFADRYAYLALWGFAWFAAEAVYSPAELSGRFLLSRLAMTVVLCAWFAIPAHSLCCEHVSAAKFWSYVRDRNPRSPYARLNLANALKKAGAPDEDIEAEFTAMAELAPDFSPGILKFADFRMKQSRPEEAMRLVDDLLGRPLKPRQRAETLHWHGRALLSAKRYAEARKEFAEARKLGLDSSKFHYDYGEALQKDLRWREAHDEWMLASKNPRFSKSARRAFLLLADPPQRKTRRLMVVGDSVPHGTSSGLDGSNGPSLAERLSKRLPGLAFRDATMPGSTARSLRGALGKLLSENGSIAVCIIMTGHNDAFFGRSVREMASDIAGCVLAARSAGVVPVVIGPIPVRDAPGKDRGSQEKTLAELDIFLSEFCPSAGIMYLSVRSRLKSDGAKPETLLVLDEGNHLNDSGMEWLATTVANLVAKRIGMGNVPDGIVRPGPFH